MSDSCRQTIQQELEQIPVGSKAKVQGEILVSRPLDTRWCVNVGRNGFWLDLFGAIDLIEDLSPR